MRHSSLCLAAVFLFSSLLLGQHSSSGSSSSSSSGGGGGSHSSSGGSASSGSSGGGSHSSYSGGSSGGSHSSAGGGHGSAGGGGHSSPGGGHTSNVGGSSAHSSTHGTSAHTSNSFAATHSEERDFRTRRSSWHSRANCGFPCQARNAQSEEVSSPFCGILSGVRNAKTPLLICVTAYVCRVPARSVRMEWWRAKADAEARLCTNKTMTSAPRPKYGEAGLASRRHGCWTTAADTGR